MEGGYLAEELSHIWQFAVTLCKLRGCSIIRILWLRIQDNRDILFKTDTDMGFVDDTIKKREADIILSTERFFNGNM